MFIVNEDNTIHATRGDVGLLGVTADKDGSAYVFQAGDVVRLTLYGKKDAETIYLRKDFHVTEETEQVDIYLTEADTKFGPVISKPAEYWYEICLNPDTAPQTIVGYTEDGPAVFKLYPEGEGVKA